MAYYNFNAKLRVMAHYVGNVIRYYTYFTITTVQTNKLDSHLNIVTSLKVHCSLTAIWSVNKG